LPKEFIKEIRLGPSSGDLLLINEQMIDAVQDLHCFNKEEGVTDRRIIAMFPDEKEAVQQAFIMLRNVASY